MSALVFAVTLILTCNASPDTSVKGYKLHVGIAPGVYTEHIDVGKVTATNYTANQTSNVYFAVSAYNDFVDSPNSSEVIAALNPTPAPTGLKVSR